jgi:hypothetical protein
MRIKFKRVAQSEQRFTTLGYWSWTHPNNRGTLVIEVSRMKDWRHEGAVWGHEVIESLYCKLMGITTEFCDRYDEEFEKKYATGEVSPMVEAGDQTNCPYHTGHFWGCLWERFFIALTLCRWNEYVVACEKQMGVG